MRRKGASSVLPDACPCKRENCRLARHQPKCTVLCGALTWRLPTSGSEPPETRRSEHSPLAPQITRRRPRGVTADALVRPEGGDPATPVSLHPQRGDTGVTAQITHHDG